MRERPEAPAGEEAGQRGSACLGERGADTLRRVDFAEELYKVDIGVNKVFDTPYLRVEYSSLTTPQQWIDLDMRADASPRDTLVKEQEEGSSKVPLPGGRLETAAARTRPPAARCGRGGIELSNTGPR